MDENEIGRQIVDAAIAVHRELGPGLLETIYEVVLLAAWREKFGISVTQNPEPRTNPATV